MGGASFGDGLLQRVHFCRVLSAREKLVEEGGLLPGGIDAGDEAKLEAVKAAKRAEINAACDIAVASLAASYPEREVQSWPQQVKEAEALAADPQAQAPLLAAIAEARSLPLAELASRVLGKMNAYAGASGALIGRRQAAEDLIDLADTAEDVASVTW